MKTRLSKTKIFIWKFIPITHSIIYHYQKYKKSSLLPWIYWGSFLIGFVLGFIVIRSSLGFSGIRFSPQWYCPLWVLSYKLFFRVLSNRFFSWVISALFPACRYFWRKTFVIETQNVILKIYVINFLIYKLSILLNI